MQESTFTFTANDGTEIAAYRWSPDGAPRRIVQIAHGMGEHAGRYRRPTALFAAAAELGAVVADRPRVEAEALRSYGANLGIAFQLIDDVLDYSSREVVLGKSIGDDFRDGKITLPVVLALQRGDASERRFWRRTLEQVEQGDDDLLQAIELLERHAALTDSVAQAVRYGDTARRALEVFPNSSTKSAMLDLVDFCLERAF